MLLKSITLHNIRSYLDQEILFPSSSTLLSGDIGSGKSTILLAIEFALFGTSPDLSSEMLLRKGQPTGSIKLTFSIDGQEVTIERQLKKEKDGIKQKAGSFIFNNQRKDLTPVELKAEMIGRLGYPKELASKSKNFVYRYTVYCPQELMKEILEESPEERLHTLRKIFNVDKYQQIRANIQIYLRQLRKQLLILETRLEGFPELEKELVRLAEERKVAMERINQLSPQHDTITTESEKIKETMTLIEQHQQRYYQLQLQLQQIITKREEKKRQQELLAKRVAELQQKKESFQIPADKQEIERQIASIDQQLTSISTKKSTVQEKITAVQQRIAEVVKETALLPTLQQEEESLRNRLLQLQETVLRKPIIQKQQQEAEERLSRITFTFQNIQKEEERIQHLIQALDQQEACPWCQQPLSETHKHTLSEREQKNLHEQRLAKEQLQQEKEQVRQRLPQLVLECEQLTSNEHQVIQLTTTLHHVKEKITIATGRKEILPPLLQENNQLMKESEQLQTINITLLHQEKKRWQEEFQRLIQKQETERYLTETENHVQQTIIEYDALEKKYQKLFQEGTLLPDRSSELQKHQQQLHQLQTSAMQLLVELTRLWTTEEQLQNAIHSRENDRAAQLQIKEQVTKLSALQHWLEQQFIPLTATIERQVMATIHRLFSQLFQEWFSMLLENELLSARLDDSFTPVIEQDGYDILFPHLSGGERTSASLAYRLALNKVINEVIHEIKTKDLLILDEPTDGFSSEQLDKVRDVLERLNLKQIIIVSHESKIESFVENVIRIHKEGQVSRVMG